MVGDDYPFKDKDGNPELPGYQFMCFPSTQGQYNEGLGSLFYRIHIQLKQLLNMAVAAVQNRVDPVYLVSLETEDQGELENKILKALQDKRQGGMGIVSLGRNTRTGSPKAQQIQSLIGENMTSEFERMLTQYDLLIKRIGINLDDIPQTVDTATQAQLAEQAANGFVEQIMEINADEIKRVYEGLLTDIRDFVDEDDDTLIRSDVEPVREEGQEVTANSPTLGGISMALNEFSFEVIVEKRSGSHPNFLADLQRTKENSERLGVVAPGSKAHIAAETRFLQLRGQEIQEGDLKSEQPPQAQPAAAGQPAPAQPVPTQ